MRIRIEKHSDYELLDADAVTDLCDRAKLDLRVGFEIEMHYRDEPEDMHGPGYEGADVLNDIQAAFEKKYGFTMAIGKGECNKKKLKRSFSDGRTQFEIPIEVDIDGYKEHLLVPYGYVDGSTPVELVTSPVAPRISIIRETFDSIYKVVEEVDTGLTPICHNKCGLHQTVVFEHLKTHFPPIVVANAIQIARTFLPGIFYLFSSGTKNRPTRTLEHRGFNGSVWHRHISMVSKYSMVYPRKNADGLYWGIEFRYPDGTQSTVLPGVTAVVNSAIVLKAIKLSRFGIVQISEDYFLKLKNSIDLFTADSLFNDDVLKDDGMIPRVVARELVKFLSEEINDIDKSAFPILDKLVESPLWARVPNYWDMTAKTYRLMDADLLRQEKKGSGIKDRLDMAVSMDASATKDRKNATRRIARQMNLTYADVGKALTEHGFIWSGKLGKFIERE